MSNHMDGCSSLRLAVGIDVGGTKIAAGLVDLATGAVIARETVPTRPERGAQVLLNEVVTIAERLKAESEDREQSITGIGLCVAELVDPHGTITSRHTIPWRGVPVQQRLAQIAPAAVDADVRTHALAEARYGAGQPFRQFVFVTVGTGISSCLVIDGRPHAGARGNALVLASSPITTACNECGAELRPVLEAFASGPALVARYNQRSDMHFASGEQVFAALAKGDADAEHVTRTAGDALGVSIGWLVNVLDPEAVIIGGGLGLAGGLYWEHMVASARRHIWAEDSRQLPFLRAALGPDAGLIGAAALLGSE